MSIVLIYKSKCLIIAVCRNIAAMYKFLVGGIIMKFDYAVGTEATFYDWENDGCEKAKAILNALENESASAAVAQDNIKSSSK